MLEDVDWTETSNQKLLASKPYTEMILEFYGEHKSLFYSTIAIRSVSGYPSIDISSIDLETAKSKFKSSEENFNLYIDMIFNAHADRFKY